MASKLIDICSYAKGKTAVVGLTTKTYISTENMLPNKGGITTATNLPSVDQTQAYRKNDVLVSNIRPYFKKIWHAEYDGGCSNDVLVFRAAEDVDPTFLYYVLADDTFFNYATATSKGTKMPRGDKSAIMEYSVPTLEIEVQRKIGALLRSIDQKIAVNSKINDNLEQQAQAIYKSWFVDFEPFGGVMPSSWREGMLSEIADILSGKRPPIKQAEKSPDANIPLVGAAAVMGYTNDFNYDERILVTGRVGTHGVVQRFNSRCWASDNTLVVKSNYYEYVYQILQGIDYKSMNRGSTQPLITQGDLKKTKILIPCIDDLLKYETIVAPLMGKYTSNIQENIMLSNLRDTLLPKLMNGEIDVSEVEI